MTREEERGGQQETGALTVLRCTICGDTFPSVEKDGARCPSCGGERLEIAGEPLL